MKYCPVCKRVFFTDERKCPSGHKLKNDPDHEVPVVLTVSDGGKRQIEGALVEAEIPYSIADGSGYSPAVGRIGGGAAFLIPLGFLKKGIDVLAEKGLAERPDWYESLDLPEDPVFEEMPKGKQTAVRILSFIAFLALIWLCVAGVDFVANLITRAFSG